MSIKYSNQDHYLDEKSGVLKNKLGIEDGDKLEKAEAALVAVRTFELRQSPLAGKHDFCHLLAIHKYLFQDVYEWAGQLRDINISKDSSTFAAFNYIEDAAKPIFSGIATEEFLIGLDAESFSKRSAYYLSEINALHPFREGNGRAQREFINHLAYKSGFVIEWEKASPEEILDTAIRSFNGDVSGLQNLILKFLIKRE